VAQTRTRKKLAWTKEMYLNIHTKNCRTASALFILLAGSTKKSSTQS